jgi:hypothetical protein
MSALECLPVQLFSYLGEFLELQDIANISCSSKILLNNVSKDKIYFHYSKRLEFSESTLPEIYTKWKDYVRDIKTSIVWGKFYVSDYLEITKDRKRIKSSNWNSTISKNYFERGKHFLLIKLVGYKLGFLGIANENTDLTGFCTGYDCFAYSSFYSDFRFFFCFCISFFFIFHF